MSKHTPGPWRIGTQPPNGMQTIGTHKGLMVAVATTGLGMPTLANASLIAAAPEMLDALKLVVDTFENGGWPSATIVIAKGAIAKAEGNDVVIK